MVDEKHAESGSTTKRGELRPFLVLFLTLSLADAIATALALAHGMEAASIAGWLYAHWGWAAVLALKALVVVLVAAGVPWLHRSSPNVAGWVAVLGVIFQAVGITNAILAFIASLP